jgi:hypothetical protein
MREKRKSHSESHQEYNHKIKLERGREQYLSRRDRDRRDRKSI